jgi:hypothetical protein
MAANGAVHYVEWEPDKEASACRLCLRPFSLLRRRHHCRKCGKLVCISCSSFKAVLFPESHEKHEREQEVRFCARTYADHRSGFLSCVVLTFLATDFPVQAASYIGSRVRLAGIGHPSRGILRLVPGRVARHRLRPGYAKLPMSFGLQVSVKRSFRPLQALSCDDAGLRKSSGSMGASVRPWKRIPLAWS